MPSRVASKKKANIKLSEQIYHLLKRDIIECVYEPGQTLQESAVRETYKIGHTPFREACARLKAEGLIQIVPHRGYFVAPFSPSLIQDLFELRLMVEPKASEGSWTLHPAASTTDVGERSEKHDPTAVAMPPMATLVATRAIHKVGRFIAPLPPRQPCLS